MDKKLPSFAPWPAPDWRAQIKSEDWILYLEAYVSLIEVHLRLPDREFKRTSAADESLLSFLQSYVASETVKSESVSSTEEEKTAKLRKQVFFLTYRLLDLSSPPEALLRWDFLANLCRTFGRGHSQRLLENVWKRHTDIVEADLSQLKTDLIKQLDLGLKGDFAGLEGKLKRLNHLLHTSSTVCEFFMAGSDFLDGLVSCYKIMNPPLRKAILSTTYLCVIGLTEGDKPSVSLLADQLYALKAAADAHKAGPTNVNDSLVAELVTATPITKQIRQRLDAKGVATSRMSARLTELETFHKGGGAVARRPAGKKVPKGKAVAAEPQDIHIHRMSFISQIQDLFPDLGAGFIVKLLDEYNDNVELVTAHLLEDSLPPHLQQVDRHEPLPSTSGQPKGTEHHDIAPRSTPPLLPTRRNVFDDDELDRLAVDTSRLHFGRRDADKTADDILKDRSAAPNKAAILSALASFDFDDDERDDTYDVQDVGGTVDSATPGNNPEEKDNESHDAHDETLYAAFKGAPTIFGRDARRTQARDSLKRETGMTDEAIEGWATMLSRDPRRLKRLEARFSEPAVAQPELERTSWRASPAGSGTEESDADAGRGGRGRGRGGRGRGRGRGGGGGGRGGGNVAGPASEKETLVARQRKEANKGSRANHNRRDQRAKKMARGGFPG